jgi:hypothetical protein
MDLLDWSLLLGALWILAGVWLAIRLGRFMREDGYLFGFHMQDKDKK